jgi:hypothetical protein
LSRQALQLLFELPPLLQQAAELLREGQVVELWRRPSLDDRRARVDLVRDRFVEQVQPAE